MLYQSTYGRKDKGIPIKVLINWLQPVRYIITNAFKLYKDIPFGIRIQPQFSKIILFFFFRKNALLGAKKAIK
jgi:hypothetical protein